MWDNREITVEYGEYQKVFFEVLKASKVYDFDD